MEQGQPGENLLSNGGFEQNGQAGDPLVWWQANIQTAPLEPLASGVEGLSYQNASDMLAGRYDAIRQRATQLGAGCVDAPEMTAWLTAGGDEFERSAGAAARERLYRLAIALAPGCPQPYASLGELYESRKAYTQAVAFYHQAASLAGDTALAGRYAFNEGFLEVRQTGELQKAIAALQFAESHPGWEYGLWYRGVATDFLAQALETDGQNQEALAAYQRLLDCGQCSNYQEEALKKIRQLSQGDH